MRHYTKKENKELVKRYPFLLPRNVWTDKVPEDYDYSYTLFDEVPDMWRKKFGKQMLEELRDILVEGNYLKKYRFMQIKEKYGTLRMYSNSIPNSIWDKYQAWEAKYEALSGAVCFFCGADSEGFTSGWILPACKECLAKPYNERKVMSDG